MKSLLTLNITTQEIQGPHMVISFDDSEEGRETIKDERILGEMLKHVIENIHEIESIKAEHDNKINN